MSETRERILDGGVIAIMRAQDSRGLIRAAEAILAGGVQVVEVSLTTAGALEVISAVRKRFEGELLFGAGTVLDAKTAQAAMEGGAQFVVSPTFDPQTVAACRQREVPVIPGAFTPTELLAAWRAGAELVKLFPANLAGPAGVEALLGPLPQLKLVPVGGVDEDNLAEYLRAGAAAVGVGSSLVSQELLDREDFDEITARARRLRAAAEGVRS